MQPTKAMKYFFSYKKEFDFLLAMGNYSWEVAREMRSGGGEKQMQRVENQN
jgi:hypothetical protein